MKESGKGMQIPWSIPNINEDDVEYVKSVLDTGWFSMGKEVKKFEENMASYVNRKYGIAVNNGTSALELALRSLNIGFDDEVIVPALSFMATASAVSMIGAKPVFVDVDRYLTIDTSKIEEKITEKTKAIVSVDLCGGPCDYGRLTETCDKYSLNLIVDGAQSLGSRYNKKTCHQYGILSTISFHAAKVITTVEGGMIFTDDHELNSKLRAMRSHGEASVKYRHEYLGGNYRMTDIAAAFGNGQMKRIDKLLENRQRQVDFYKERLEGVKSLTIRKGCISGNFMFLVFVDDNVKLGDRLRECGIDTRIIYPLPIPHQPAYNKDGSYPMAEWSSKHSLSLPLYDKLTDEQIEYICSKLGVNR